MLSRVAENLYWTARYIERTEDTARLVSVNSHLLLDLPHHTALGWSTLIDITGSDQLFDERFERRSEKNVLHFLCMERDNPGSILASLASARENLRTTRDVVSREIWEQINELYLEVRESSDAGLAPRRRDAFLKRVIRGCQTVTGLIEGTLSHTATRCFIELGRHLERADMTTRILDVRSGNLLPKDPEELRPFENLQWMS
ncbi:alpha-E domain-containing protein, partial [Halomonas sp. BBD48]|nr:alpha-E domain-containing protein [Halomonas sp. BBD48]